MEDCCVFSGCRFIISQTAWVFHHQKLTYFIVNMYTNPPSRDDSEVAIYIWGLWFRQSVWGGRGSAKFSVGRLPCHFWALALRGKYVKSEYEWNQDGSWGCSCRVFFSCFLELELSAPLLTPVALKSVLLLICNELVEPLVSRPCTWPRKAGLWGREWVLSTVSEMVRHQDPSEIIYRFKGCWKWFLTINCFHSG